MEIFYPLSLSLFLLAAGVLAWNRVRRARWLCAAALGMLLVFAWPPFAAALLRTLENQYPDTPVEACRAQAIVVLGGNLHMPTPWHGDSGLIDESDRLLHTLRLYRAGAAPLVVCSGAGNPAISEAQVMRRLLVEWGVPAASILLEEGSKSTRENAQFTYALLQARGIRHIALVTSAIHMPRAVAVFRRSGFEVTPSPADFRTGWGSGGWIPRASYLMWSERAWKEWLGLLVYRLRGWA